MVKWHKTKGSYMLKKSLILTAGLMAASSQAAEKPNVIFILADDLGYGDVSCFNPESKIKTPNMDLLAAEGMRFTDAHSGSAVCTPTRYGVITGRYCWRSRLKKGVLNGYSGHLINPDRLTVADVMKNAGYATACIGKWHLGMDFPKGKESDKYQGKNKKKNVDYTGKIENTPNSLGFDYFFGISASLDFPPYVYIENDRFTEVASGYCEKVGFPGFYRQGHIAPNFKHDEVLDEFTEKSVEFIGKQAKSNKPFFLYFPLSSPHKPVLPAPRFRGKSGLGAYGDFVMQTDDVIGRVLKAVKDNGIEENTLVIVTSDNASFMYRYTDGNCHTKKDSAHGFDPKNHTSNYHFRGTKCDIYEGGHHVPYLVRWPKVVKAGTECKATICTTDLMATCAAILGTKLPDTAGEDSYNLLPYFTNKTPLVPRVNVVNHSASGSFALRNGKWKMIFTNGSCGREIPKGLRFEKPWKLFDLEKDISEKNNVIDKYPEVAEEMTKTMGALIRNGRSTPGAPQKNEGKIPDLPKNME